MHMVIGTEQHGTAKYGFPSLYQHSSRTHCISENSASIDSQVSSEDQHSLMALGDAVEEEHRESLVLVIN